MNTTTAEIAADSDLPAKALKAHSGKRRMARKPGKPAAGAPTDEPHGGAAVVPSAATPASTSKISSVIALLGRKQGATLAEMVEATGWLPHTTRAALTGLKKKGHTLTKDKRDDVTCYRIVKAA